MAILDMFDKLDDIIYKPIETICEWAKEPLRRSQAKREADERNQEANIEIEKERQRAIINADIRRWDEEINDLICSNEIKRNKKILDTITEYRRSMIEDAQNIADNLSRMQMALVEEAHELVLLMTEKYKSLQDKAMKQCDEQLEEIQKRYSNNERVRIKREDQVLNQVDDIIKVATMFISQLNNDIKEINEGNKIRVDDATRQIDIMMNKYGNSIGNNYSADNIPFIDTPNQVRLK